MHIADGLLLMWRGETELSGRHGYTAPAAAGALLTAARIARVDARAPTVIRTPPAG